MTSYDLIKKDKDGLYRPRENGASDLSVLKECCECKEQASQGRKETPNFMLLQDC